MELAALTRAVLAGRPALFVDDFAAAAGQLRTAFAGSKVLVIGAGGSIGRATAELLLEQRPARTLLVDLSENNLAAVTRRLRNRFGADCPDFAAWPLDFTGPAFTALLALEQPDVVLNFAAFKHVRSEKDQLSLAELLRVNVFGNLQLMHWALEHRPRRVFAISTDKAANPANCMGASKRLMEMLLWAADASQSGETCFTSTRFANVLFSDGSLPASFLDRIAQRQPLAGPDDVERYFITSEDAARLCLLAASHPRSSEILVPRMSAADRIRFDTIAERMLAELGYRAKHYGEDAEAAQGNLDSDAANGAWPCLFSPSTTSGEKDAEEFRQADEELSVEQPYAQIETIRSGNKDGIAELAVALDNWETQLHDPQWLAEHSKADIVQTLQHFVPSLSHSETGLSLDSRR